MQAHPPTVEEEHMVSWKKGEQLAGETGRKNTGSWAWAVPKADEKIGDGPATQPLP